MAQGVDDILRRLSAHLSLIRAGGVGRPGF
jgi:hypothetical protein